MWRQLGRLEQTDLMSCSICTGSFIKCKLQSLDAAVRLSAGLSLYADEQSQTGVKYAASALTRWTRSRENMWILQVTVDRVQMMVERMLRPHALNRRSCGGICVQEM